MSQWPSINLEAICRPKQWPTIPKLKFLPSGYPVFGANGVIGHYCEYNHEDPTILITCRGATCGSLNVCEPKSYVTGNAMALDSLDEKQADLRYLFRALEETDFSSVITGVAQPQITRQSLARLQIPLPPLEEQKRIAAILDAADDLRAKRRESLAQLDALLQSTFLDMFGDPVTNPMGWNLEELGKICDVRDGTHDTPKYVQEGKPLLTSKNFKDGAIDIEGANLISDEDFHQINKRSKVDVGDLVMPMIGTIGNPVLVEREQEFAIKNVALFKFSAASPNNKFVRALLCSHYFNYVTSKANRGGTQKFVALKDLRGMPIPYPPIDLQRRFAAIVDSVEQQKAKQRAHLDELDTLFSSLQSRAFKGEL